MTSISAQDYTAELIQTARAIGAPGKGILAADESTGTIGKRFAPINVENTQDNRRKYRQLLITTPGLSQYISGCIMFEESLFEKDENGKDFTAILKENGIIPGIKIDKGVRFLAGTDGETVTQGIDGLADRCRKYYAQGARFSKWRSVLHIKDSGCPTKLAIDANAYVLARMASISQECGLVPIVEPEILMDGEHSIERSAEVTQKVLAATFKALSDHHVMLEGCLLKPNMVRSGSQAAKKAPPQDIARCTVRVLQNTVPPALPTISFLSGGMSEEEATVALDCINKFGDKSKKPWSLTFSYGRALQKSVLQAWKGSEANVEAAQKELMIRAKANSEAQLGVYSGSGAAGKAASQSLDVKNYVY